MLVHHKVLSLNHRKMRDIISYAVCYIRSSFSKTSRIEIRDTDLPLQYKQSESMNEKLTSTKNQGLNALRETGQGKQCSLWRLHYFFFSEDLTSWIDCEDCKRAFCAGNSAMKSNVWAQPAYSPYLDTNASATRLQSLSVSLAPARSGTRYLVAIWFITPKQKSYFSHRPAKANQVTTIHKLRRRWTLLPARHAYQREWHYADQGKTELCKLLPSDQPQAMYTEQQSHLGDPVCVETEAIHRHHLASTAKHSLYPLCTSLWSPHTRCKPKKNQSCLL